MRRCTEGQATQSIRRWDRYMMPERQLGQVGQLGADVSPSMEGTTGRKKIDICHESLVPSSAHMIP